MTDRGCQNGTIGRATQRDIRGACRNLAGVDPKVAWKIPRLPRVIVVFRVRGALEPDVAVVPDDHARRRSSNTVSGRDQNLVADRRSGALIAAVIGKNKCGRPILAHSAYPSQYLWRSPEAIRDSLHPEISRCSIRGCKRNKRGSCQNPAHSFSHLL
jgi:hypothetical protein